MRLGDKRVKVLDKNQHLMIWPTYITQGRRQSNTRFTIDKRGSKIDKNSVSNCHLSPVGRQMTIKNSVSNDFLSTFVDSIEFLIAA